MRNVPIDLQSALGSDCTTLCTLLKIRNAEGTIIGLTSLDRTVTYDAGDGDGAVIYYPDPGFEPAEIEAVNDLGVDNTVGRVLLPLSAMPMNAADIRRGLWDDATFKVLRVNYADLDNGHYEMLSGVIGDVTLRNNVLLVIQLDGNARPLRQTACWRDSLTCRAIFGSQEGDEVEFCGFDATTLEIAFTVTSVDPDEPNRVFTASALAQADGYFVPGVVIWDTGANASAVNFVWGVDSFSGGEIGLRDPLRYNAQVGDAGRIRMDCTKDVEGDKGCRFHWGADWVNHARMEPHIPMGGDALMPGAQVGPGAGGSTDIPEEEA